MYCHKRTEQKKWARFLTNYHSRGYLLCSQMVEVSVATIQKRAALVETSDNLSTTRFAVVVVALVII